MRLIHLQLLSFFFAGCTHGKAPASNPSRSATDAQTPTNVARIGWMSRGNPTANDTDMEAFRQGMRELGYSEGKTFVIEPRYARGNLELLPEQAAELERAGVDVIVAGPFDALVAAKRNTRRVPIIMTPSADPVAAGVVESLNRPGGTVTGITEMMPELTPIRLALLKQIVPALNRVAILWKPGTLSEATFARMLKETQDTARALGVELRVITAANVQVIDRASQQRLAAIYEWKSWVQRGGLISFGADVQDVYRRAAGYVDKILKGANPADLPVEGPTKVEIAVNLKTAESLGVRIPDSIIKRAVEVIDIDRK